MVDFLQVREFVDGEVLSKIEWSKMFDNDAFFHAVADGWQPVVNGVARQYVADEAAVVIFDGWHWLDADATLLSYRLDLTNSNAAHPSTITLYYAYGQAEQLTVDSRNTTGSTEDTYDLSALDPGFYRVYCTMTRAAGDVGYQAAGTCYPPFTTYTGALSWTAPPDIADGLLSDAAAHLNVWRANQLYLYAQLSPNVPSISVYRGYNAAENALVIWWGWIYHRFLRVRYRAWLRNDAGGNRLRVYYDYGGANETLIADLTDTTEVESYTDLPPATFAPGARYLVAALLTRTDTSEDTNGRLRYVMESPAAATAGYTALGELAAGQYVFGDTAGETTRADLLSDNQVNLEARLTGTRRDYAVRKASYTDVAESTWMYWIQHRFHLLRYRGQNLVLKYGSGNDYQTLDDTDDGDNLYRVFDLRSIPGLARGVHYHIEGTPEYAAEFKEL